MNTSIEPHSSNLGDPLPPKDKHAVSVSLPKWDFVIRTMAGDDSVNDRLQSNYPRFFQHPIVQKLNEAVLDRVEAAKDTGCVIFPSQDAATRCVDHFRDNMKSPRPISTVSFTLTRHLLESRSEMNAIWARFNAVLYHQDLTGYAEQFWAIFGDGISSRHAAFCIERFPFMESISSFHHLNTSPTYDYYERIPLQQWRHSDNDAKNEIKTWIAKWAKSEHLDYKPPLAQDVFLYPKGMCSINTISRVLVPSSKESNASEVVIIGWPYGSTPKCVKRCGYERFTFYPQGSSEQLDHFESSLASGRQVTVVFCEIPSNPLLSSPDLRRIRKLADQYHFIVVCDETLGTFINVDLLPYVDVLVTSLTKIFSGACNVMGGSLVINPQSSYYEAIHTKLSATYEDLLFPTDAATLLENCSNFPSRVHRANSTASSIAKFLSTNSLIERVNYPSIVPSKPIYEQYRRPSGGYGFLLSIIFHHPEHAVHFYDTLDLSKGPSLGTNFTIVLPYAQLAHHNELDWAESQGVPKHIVRISVGLEDESVLLKRFAQALAEVENREGSSPAVSIRSVISTEEHDGPRDRSASASSVVGKDDEVDVGEVAHFD